ncbi:MAG: response regulator [Sulfuritalea sp.]|nr:response regulator [Sulfuritalea sp.]
MSKSDQQRDTLALKRRRQEESVPKRLGLRYDQPGMQHLLYQLPAHRARLEVQPSSRRTLLQIENNLANAEIVEQLIARRNDLKLLTAIDAYTGIAMARLYQPDAILMDMKMPGIDGRGALKILRENPVTAHIPVIAISSNAYKVEIEQCLAAGFFRYVTKPFMIDELMALIDVALRYSAQNHPAKWC